MDSDGVPQQTIANWTKMDRSRTSKMIDALEDANLVMRKDDPESRRTKLIYLTPYAKTKKAEIIQCVMSALDQAFHGFNEEERAHMTRGLQRILKNLT